MPFLGAYLDKLHGSDVQVAAVVLVAQAVMIPVALAAGSLCDRWGRKWVFGIGFVVREMRQVDVPKSPGFRRLRYSRYADDHLLGFTGPRAEAEEIIARTSALTGPPTLAALQQELLSLIAEMDAFYRDVLNREQARGSQADPEELRQAREVLAALKGYQGQITGLKPGDAGSASFRLPPSPA